MEAAPTAVTRSPAVAAPARPAPPYRPPSRGYYYEEPPPRRRPFWPWLLVLLLLVAAGGAVWLAWGKIQEELDEAETIAVPDVRGIREIRAVRRLRAQGLEPRVERVRDADVREGFVISQDPAAGDRVPRGNVVLVRSSLGPPTAVVPDVRGRTVADAVAVLTERGLKYKPFDVPSSKPEDTVVAQNPAPNETVAAGTTVRINVSKGPQPVFVPPVVGELFEDAQAQLEQAGFVVVRRDVESNEQRGVVIGQNPGPNAAAARGATVTLHVSQGPTAVTVPDVLGFDEASATSELEAAGLQVRVRDEVTDDETADGTVVDQRPAPGARVRPNATVTIVIARFGGATPPDDETVP